MNSRSSHSGLSLFGHVAILLIVLVFCLLLSHINDYQYHHLMDNCTSCLLFAGMLRAISRELCAPFTVGLSFFHSVDPIVVNTAVFIDIKQATKMPKKRAVVILNRCTIITPYTRQLGLRANLASPPMIYNFDPFPPINSAPAAAIHSFPVSTTLVWKITVFPSFHISVLSVCPGKTVPANLTLMFLKGPYVW